MKKNYQITESLIEHRPMPASAKKALGNKRKRSLTAPPL
jgi:hypothetical protein